MIVLCKCTGLINTKKVVEHQDIVLLPLRYDNVRVLGWEI